MRQANHSPLSQLIHSSPYYSSLTEQEAKERAGLSRSQFYRRLFSAAHMGHPHHRAERAEFIRANIIALLREIPALDAVELAKRIEPHISARAMRNHLNILNAAGKVRRENHQWKLR